MMNEVRTITMSKLRERDRENSNKIFYKDCSLGSVENQRTIIMST